MEYRLPNLDGLANGTWNVICDFDGTITPFDVTDAVLSRFADPAWEEVEREWTRGTITARECMARQIPMIRASLAELDAFLATVPLTEGFKEFAAWCREKELTAHVISDGMDYVIRRVLAQHGVNGLPVIANHLVHSQELSPAVFSLEFPYSETGCPSGVCKCAAVKAEGKPILLIGDGRSDICLAENASFVLAKKGETLHAHCREHGLPQAGFDDFFDIRDAFAVALPLPSTFSAPAKRIFP